MEKQQQKMGRELGLLRRPVGSLLSKRLYRGLGGSLHIVNMDKIVLSRDYLPP